MVDNSPSNRLGLELSGDDDEEEDQEDEDRDDEPPVVREPEPDE
jgi:hypothetical protein